MHELKNGLNMRKVVMSGKVLDKISELESYLKEELKLPMKSLMVG